MPVREKTMKQQIHTELQLKSSGVISLKIKRSVSIFVIMLSLSCFCLKNAAQTGFPVCAASVRLAF